MAVYHRGFGIWVKMPGTVQVPVGLLGELRNRFSAAAALVGLCSYYTCRGTLNLIFFFCRTEGLVILLFFDLAYEDGHQEPQQATRNT